jgi:hypothetical protein
VSLTLSVREKLLSVSIPLLASALALLAAARVPASPGPPLTDSGGLTVAALSRTRAAQSKPPEGAKVYRGSIGGRGVEVSLRREGERVSGSYSYDGRAERLRLEGRVGADGKLTLAEFDRAGRQTGKFACEPGGGDRIALDIDLECEWSRADGADRTYAGLTEQHAAFTRAWRVEPREIVNRRYGVGVTYPQLVAARGARLTPGALAFNRRAAALASEVVREFAAGPPERGMYLRVNYDVLLATDDLISVELEEERDFGGGRPGTRHFGINYDLRSGRELRLADLFKPGSESEHALRLQAYEKINRSCREINRREAAGGTPTRGEDLMQPGRDDEIAAWALTPRGVIIYFNFPQVMAAFSRNFVPYEAVKELLRADGPAAGVARAAR